MKVSVVIVSYNVSHYLLQCLDSVKRSLRGIESEVIVIDNHSRDDSPTLVRRYHPEARVIESLHNLGFAKANNIAIRQAKGDYVLLVNPDTFLGESVIDDVVHFLDSHQRAGAVGLMMVNADGTLAPESRRAVPTPMTAFYKFTGLCSMFPKNRRFGKYYLGFLPWDSPQRIEVVSGAVCMVRKTVLDTIGLLDEDYFMYGEDIDLSCRILKAGYENWYLPARIVHYKGESTQKSSFAHVHVFYRAMLIFFRKHYSHLAAIISVPIEAAILVKALSAAVVTTYRKMKKSLGFPYPSHVTSSMEFHCFGTEATIEACRQICSTHAIIAHFHVTTDTTYINNVVNGIKRQSVIVLDPSSLGFSTVIDILTTHSHAPVTLGTYHPSTNSIITINDIIR